MPSEVGQYFRSLREGRGWNLAEAARKLGYRNINKGCRTLQALEEGGDASDDIRPKLVELLRPDPGRVQELAAADDAKQQAERDAWLNEPIRPHICCSPVPAIGVVKHFPPGCETRQQMEEFAARFSMTFANYADKQRRRVLLVLSRRESVWFERGQVVGRAEGTSGARLDSPAGPTPP